jgi:hypothetical protein
MLDDIKAKQIRELTEKVIMNEWCNPNALYGGVASRGNFTKEQLEDMVMLVQHIAILVVMEYDRLKDNTDQ